MSVHERHQKSSTVAIVESRSVLRRGLRALIGVAHDVCAEAETVADLLPALATHAPDIVMLGPPSAADVETWASYARAASPGSRLVALVEEIDGHRLAAVLRDGVQAVLAKSVEDDEVFDALARVARGERVIDQRFLPLLFSGDLAPADVVDVTDAGTSALTDRERDVLVQLAKGATNREIASSLVVGESTVKTHLSSIYDKLDVDSRHRAVWKAIELGILQ